MVLDTTNDNANFPRGHVAVAEHVRKERIQTTEKLQRRSALKERKKKRRTSEVEKDNLFGRDNDGDDNETTSTNTKQRNNKRSKFEYDRRATSVLPVGGGGVVWKRGTKKQKKKIGYVETFNFDKLSSPSVKVLGVCKEIHDNDDICIFALPNFWMAYMKLDDNCVLEIGCTYPLVIVKAVQQSMKHQSSMTRKQIEVTIDLDRINPMDLLTTTTKPSNDDDSDDDDDKVVVVTGQVVSLEDHGVIVSLGLQRRGFLNYNDVEDLEQQRDSTTTSFVLGQIVTCTATKSASTVLPLQRPRGIRQVYSVPSSMHEIVPGSLVSAVVMEDAKLTNGICVKFGPNYMFHGVIEQNHFGVTFVPDKKKKKNETKNDDVNNNNNNNECSEFQDFFSSTLPKFGTRQNFRTIVTARVLLVDPVTKDIRLTMLPHLVEQQPPDSSSLIGSVIDDCVVVRHIVGFGAVLALPPMESVPPPPVFPLLKSTSKKDDDDVNPDTVAAMKQYDQARSVRCVFVSMSKCSDNSDTMTPSSFRKRMGVASRHKVRILSDGASSSSIEGTFTGATAPSLLNAHVLTHADLVVGQVYKSVPICSNDDNHTVLVQFGVGVRGLIPVEHLLDTNVANDYRTKMLKVKFSVNAHVDVRVLSVDVRRKRCVVSAKKTFVKAPDQQIVTSYASAKVGMIAIGYVSNVTADAVYVTFCNDVYGRVSAKSLAAELGLERHADSYTVGDTVTCRIVQKRLGRFNHGGKRRRRPIDEEEEAAMQEHEKYYDLTLSLKVDDTATTEDAMDVDETENEQQQQSTSVNMHLKAGAVLPLKSVRIVQLVNGRKKETTGSGMIPGYAIVSVRSRYMVEEADLSKMPTHIECKLPYDQLQDEYDTSVTANSGSVEALDALANRLLTLGKKVAVKGMILEDPHKSTYEYSSGTGKHAVLTIRPRFVAAAEQSKKDDDDIAVVPGPQSKFYVGRSILGFVVVLHEQHGAFIRFADGMTGLVPKTKGGLLLKLFSSVVVVVQSVDTMKYPPKISLALDKGTQTKSDLVRLGGPAPVKVGDCIQKVTIDSVDARRVVVTIQDDFLSGMGTIRAEICCSMLLSKQDTDKKKKKKRNVNEGEMSSMHPFYGLKKGGTLTKLRVAFIQQRKRRWFIELTNREETDKVAFANDVKKFIKPGCTVSGIVTGIADNNHGVWVQLTHKISAFAFALDLSNDMKILNKLSKNFPVGSRMELVVVARKRDSRLSSAHLFLADKTISSAPCKKGSVVVAQIVGPEANRPDLQVKLPGGHRGRCNYTELAEIDDWKSYPCGKPNGDEMDVVYEGGDQKRDDKSDSAFPSGRFIQCRVLSQPVDGKIDVSFRESRIEGDMEDDSSPEIGQIVQAYVSVTNKTGCYLQVSRQIDGRAMLRNLCDGFLPNPEQSFATGRLVVGKVKTIQQSKKKDVTCSVEFDMRESEVTEETGMIKYEEVEIGNKYKGTVTKVVEFGVFVQLENSKHVSGLVHRSECSDNFVTSTAELYEVGDRVKVVVLKKNDEKKQLGMSMKASQFEGDENSDDEDSSSETDEKVAIKAMDLDSDDDGYVAKLAASMDKEEESEEKSDDESSDEGSDNESNESNNEESSDEDEEPPRKPAKTMDTNVGFDWNNNRPASKSKVDTDSDEEEEEEEDDESSVKDTHKSRKKHAKKRQEEDEISRREIALADGTADENPETAVDFDRLLAGDPNSSEIWIRYMSYHLALSNVVAARDVAKRAFERIEFREETEKLNVWCALLTLEMKFGTDDTLRDTLAEASRNNNAKQVYLRMCEMLEKQATTRETIHKANKMYTKMCKKFKSKKTVWIAHLEYLLKNERHDEALDLSKRALQSLKEHKHVETMSKFAQLVFEYGSAERARTIFEGLLLKHSKRLDLFSVYVDMEVKYGEVDTARMLFSKVADVNDNSIPLKLSDKKMKSFFKKWYTFEEAHGNETTQEEVKQAAKDFVEQSM